MDDGEEESGTSSIFSVSGLIFYSLDVRSNRTQMLGEHNSTHQHHQVLAALTTQLLQRRQRILMHGHTHLLTHVHLPRASSPTALLGFSVFDTLQAPLALRERRLELLMLVVPRKPGGRQLFLSRSEDSLTKVLSSQLAYERQPRRGEEHLLAHLGGVGDVGDGDKLGHGVVALEEDIEWVGVGQGGNEEGGDVVVEGGGRGGCEKLDWHEGFILDGDEEAKGICREELVELGCQLLRGCECG